MENKKVYIITGYAGSGKTTLVNFLKQYGWHIISAGQCFTDIALKHNIQNSRLSIQKFSTFYFRKYGYKKFSKILINKANGFDKIIFEGIRPKEVIKEVKNKYPLAKIIFIESSKKNRLERISHRSKLVQKDIVTIQNHSIEKNLVHIKNEADYIVTNNNDIESFVNEVKNILKD